MDAPQRPGAALLVIDRDGIVYKKCYGLADLEARQPVTTDTSFYLASISKSFTAMAIMLLAQDRRLRYEDRLPAFFRQFPSCGGEISIRHLLHHTSGLPNYVPLFSSSKEAFEWAREINGLTNEAVLQRAMDLTGPEFPVGAQYAYSGMGYVVLAMIVAIVSGQSFAEFLKARIFDPLGMKNSVAYDASRPARRRLAHGYWKEEDQFERWDYPMLTVGGGGLFSTLDDLFLWDKALNTERLVSKATLELAFTSGMTNDGTPVGYGFGWYTNVFPLLSTAERAVEVTRSPIRRRARYRLRYDVSLSAAVGRRDVRIAPVRCSAERLLLAQSGHPTTDKQCPLSGVKRTSATGYQMSAFDPKRTSAYLALLRATL